jgi:hypothetical protein
MRERLDNGGDVVTPLWWSAMPPPSAVSRPLPMNRSPAERVEAHAVRKTDAFPGISMARQRLIDNVKAALGNVASKTRAAGERAAKAVGVQVRRRDGATNAAASNQPAAEGTSAKPPAAKKAPAKKATTATPGARKAAGKKTTAKTAGRAKMPAQKTSAKAVAKKAAAKKPNQK